MAGDEPQGDGQTDDDAVPDVAETPVSARRCLVADMATGKVRRPTVAESYDRVFDGEPVDMVFKPTRPMALVTPTVARTRCGGMARFWNDNLGDGFWPTSCWQRSRRQ